MVEQRSQWKQRILWVALVALLLFLCVLIFFALYRMPGKRSPAIQDNPAHTESRPLYPGNVAG
jgi:hypothetical protein